MLAYVIVVIISIIAAPLSSFPLTFWNIVLLRMVIPVDVLSYALGLFVPMPLSRYVLATAIGVSPFAIIFAFASSWSSTAQVVFFGLLVIVLVTTYRNLRLLPRDATID
jgi:hypothetical protein